MSIWSKVYDRYRRLSPRGWLKRGRMIVCPNPTDEEVARQIRCVPMHRQSLGDKQTIAWCLAEATLVQTALALSTVDLVAAAFIPGPLLVIGDLTVATFTGYAQQSIVTAPAPFLDQVNGGVSIALPGNTFAQSGTGTINTIFGYVLQSATPTIVQTGVFPTPVVMNKAGKAIPLSLLLNWQP